MEPDAEYWRKYYRVEPKSLDGWLSNALRANESAAHQGSGESVSFPRGRNYGAKKRKAKKVTSPNHFPVLSPTPKPYDAAQLTAAHHAAAPRGDMIRNRTSTACSPRIKLDPIKLPTAPRTSLSRSNIGSKSTLSMKSTASPYIQTRKLTFSDMPTIRKDVQKVMAKRETKKFVKDFGHTTRQLLRLNLNKVDCWPEKRRAKLSKVFNAYLAATPGSASALEGMFDTEKHQTKSG